MAYAINFAPPAYSSVHGDLIYTVSDPDKLSDPVTYPNFKFIGDVYVGATLVARVKKIADPANGIGVFNVGPIVRNYLTTIFNPTAGQLIAQELGDGEFSAAVTMHFGEEWNFTPTYDMLVDLTRTFFNSYTGRVIGISTSLEARIDTIAGNGPVSRDTFLTSGYNFLNYFATSTTPVSVVVTPVGGGSAFATSFTPGAAFEMLVLNLCPAALNAIHPGAITAATTSYTVVINGNVHMYKIICEPVYQPYMIHFLNQYGGFDSKLFRKVSRRTYDIQKTDYGKLGYAIDNEGQVSYFNGNNVYNESRSVYSSLYQEKMVLNTDLLADIEYSWLRDLVFSPLIYIEDSGFFFSVAITDTDYEVKKYVNDELTNLTINIEFGTQQNAQFR